MGQVIVYDLNKPVIITNITSLHYYTPYYAPDREFLLNKRWCVETVFSFIPGVSTTASSRTLRVYVASQESVLNTQPAASARTYSRKMYAVFRSSMNSGNNNIVGSIPAITSNTMSFAALAGTIYRNAFYWSDLRFGVSVQNANADEITTLEQLRISYLEL